MAYKSVHIIMNGDSGVRCNSDGTTTGLTTIPPIFAGDKYIFELEVIDDAQAEFVLDGANCTFVLTVKSRKSSEDILAASVSFDETLWSGQATAIGSNGKVSTYLDFNTVLMTDFMKGQSEKDVYFELAERYTDDTQRTIAQWELEATGDMYNNNDLTGTTPPTSLLRDITQAAIQAAIITPFTIARGFIANAGANLWAVTANGSAATSQSYGLNVKAGTDASDTSVLVTDATGGTEYFKITGDGITHINSLVTDPVTANEIFLYDTADPANAKYKLQYNITTGGLDLIDIDTGLVNAAFVDGKVEFGADTAGGAYSPKLLVTPSNAQYGVTINAGQYGLFIKTSDVDSSDYPLKIVDSTSADTFKVDAAGLTTIKEAEITGNLTLGGGEVNGIDLATKWNKLDALPQYTETVSVTTNYTVQATDHQKIIQCNGLLTVNFPDGLVQGFETRIANVGTDTVTLTSDTIVNGQETTIINQWTVFDVYHEGSDIWNISSSGSTSVGITRISVAAAQVASTFTIQDITNMRTLNLTLDANLTLDLSGGQGNDAIVVRIDGQGTAYTFALSANLNQRGIPITLNTASGKNNYLGFVKNGSVYDLIAFSAET